MLKSSQQTLEVLEWPEFLRFYSGFVASSAAKARAARIVPSDMPEKELALAREVLDAASHDLMPALAPLEDITDLLKKSAIENHILEGIELVHVAKLAALNNETRRMGDTWKSVYPLLHEIGAKLADLKTVEQAISSQIEPTGEVKEDATSELKRINRQILSIKTRVEKALEKYLSGANYRGALQEDYVTYRHGRAVLLVRADNRSTIRGVIHGESGSGASLFVEPLNVLDLNNELAQLADRQTEEIRRILRELTALVGKECDVLLWTLHRLIDLDLLLARGRFGKAFDCVVPELTREFRIDLRQARHPLLQHTLQQQNRTVVPFSYRLDPEQKALVLTGPNTGGKTVFLKTTGLLVLMAHCGIPIPAAAGSVIPELNSIEADIGDQQSIAESLSTFSSHIRSIVRILSNLQERSFVLLDELGTGTDPEEGAPLAVAILQELLRHNIKAFVTSHHSDLKMYAYQNPQCVSAAMQFDTQNLQPTYHILLDQVGASHGLDMAAKLGMPASILESARQLSGETRREVQSFLEKLQQRIEQLTAEQRTLEQEKASWEQKSKDQQVQIDRAQHKLEERLKTLQERNTDLVRTLNARVETLLAAIKNAQVRQEMRKEYKEQVAPAIEQIKALTAEALPAPFASDFKPGEHVWVNLYKEFGEVVALKKDQAELIIRNKRFTVPLTTLERKQTLPESLPKGIQVYLEQKHVELELNLIGQTTEDGVAAADKYLDDAFVAQLPQVRIIHGFGTGKLRRAIESFLSTHPHVKSHHPEKQDRGGGGVTVVELKTR
jgi:DNA mismatch repair protein MutS2